jgi:hypothetical protein
MKSIILLCLIWFSAAFTHFSCEAGNIEYAFSYFLRGEARISYDFSQFNSFSHINWQSVNSHWRASPGGCISCRLRRILEIGCGHPESQFTDLPLILNSLGSGGNEVGDNASGADAKEAEDSGDSFIHSIVWGVLGLVVGAVLNVVVLTWWLKRKNQKPAKNSKSYWN